MKEEKIGLSKVEIALSVIGIFLLSCLVILPPLFRVVLKEKKEVIDEPKPIDIKVLTCTKLNYYSQDATVKENDTYTIKYYKDKVRTYSIKKERIYSDPLPYGEAKEAAGKQSTAYNLVEGIDFTVNPDDTGLKIVATENCDLSIFKPTTVTVPGDTDPTKVMSEYTTKDSVEEIKSNLESDGYVCK